MEDLIPVINRLQDVFASIGQKQSPIDLPQIVVVGSQSSGKSSVLENVVGKSFLPRGSGICTRRPLVLQLYNTAGNNKEEWAEFLHVPNRRFTDFDEVQREIMIETDRETGKNKGMSNKAIRLKVYSPHVLNLTLVDLPGITKVAVGDQPTNIEQLTRDMCMEYVSNPLSIILAVSPANADLANSDALKLAKEVDPNGERTIGVITKLDLVDDGCDALESLNGELIPLKRGYVGIINRSQAEINGNVALKEIRRKERSFFLNHPSYRGIANRQGTEYLTKMLNGLLLEHIREHLPELKQNVQRQLRDVERELNQLGAEAVDPSDRTAQGQVILSLINKYSNSFIDSMEGRHKLEIGLASVSGKHSSSASAASSSSSSSSKLFGGARLSRSFRQFSEKLGAISAFRELSDADISTAIMNATGPRPSLFVPELSFDVLVKRQLGHFKDPAINCAMDVFDILQEVADQSCFPGLARFSALQERVLETVNKMLSDALEPTKNMIENLIRVEQAFINTSHPDFVSKLQAIRAVHVGEATSVFAAHASVLDKDRYRLASVSSTGDDENVLAKANGFGGVSQHGSAAESVHGASSDEEASADAQPRKNNFMSFIFNERVANPSVKLPFSASTSFANHTRNVHALSEAGLSPDEPDSEAQVRVIKRLIETYLAISKKNVMDLTPKTIMYFLVNYVKETLHTELIRALYQEQLFRDLLREDEDIASARANYKETARMLQEAMAVLGSVREFKLK